MMNLNHVEVNKQEKLPHMMNLNHVEVNKQKKLPHMMNLNHVEVNKQEKPHDEKLQMYNMWGMWIFKLK
jgi:hypothetical protein